MPKKDCGAKTKRNGPCKQPAMPNGKCWLHGGKSPRGLAHPRTTHGRYSKDLPTRLAGRFEDALNDPQLGMLQSELALLDTRIGEMITGLDTEQYGSLWGEVAQARNNIKRAMETGKGRTLEDAYNHLDSIVESAQSDIETWDKIFELIEQRRKLVDSERKRQMDLQQVITTEQSMLLVTTLIRAVTEHVTDKRQLAAISNEIRTVIQ
jgi:hypothetical protein